MPRFCRHGRFAAECPICSKGTVLDPKQSGARGGRAPTPEGRRKSRGRGTPVAPSAAYTGAYVAAGPYGGPHGESYEVRMEKVPGGVRLAEWSGGSMRRRAPVLEESDLPSLLAQAARRRIVAAELAGAVGRSPSEPTAEDPASGAPPPGSGDQAYGASPGRSGELRDELRVEAIGGGRLRIARWMLRPNAGWELQEAPVMLPAARYAEAIEDAVRRGLLPSGHVASPRL